MNGGAAVIVVGSANVDRYLSMPDAPVRGATILIGDAPRFPGGKGGNQATAAARLGAEVCFIGAMGRDADASFLRQSLERSGVNVSRVEEVDDVSTGAAFILSFPTGENTVLVSPGANGRLSPDWVANALEAVSSPGAVVVTQGEISTMCVAAAARIASRTGVRLLLNLAPFVPLPADVLRHADPLVVNEVEASQVVGFAVHDLASGRRALQALRGTVASAIVTLGALGACWWEGDYEGDVRAPDLGPVVDTTGAGDALVGTIAAQLARGVPLGEAVGVGVVAGTYATLTTGAQVSYASSEALERICDATPMLLDENRRDKSKDGR